ncbi:hypothetical protein FA13DRAFT_1738101 [Coprinellus micaceus]|uniref:Uncharacterized protein n=1 Tax=Coprinellus micaceus TaxID=71717 RepID=A0A4Y7SV85_COPMI|nr:hypothetical protein FA13DRAFT_1738101 [Coprinellus micaceus]
MSALTNPYALGEWPSTPRRTFKSEDPISCPSVVNFRVVHPSTLHADGASVLAPVDILNCVVLDPTGESTSPRARVRSPCRTPAGKTGGQRPWWARWNGVHHILSSSSTTRSQSKAKVDIRFLRVRFHKRRTLSLELFLALFHTTTSVNPVLQVEAMQKRTGELELALTEAGLKRGLVDASLIALPVCIERFSEGYRF